MIRRRHRIAALGLLVAALVGASLVGCTPDDREGSTFDTTVNPAD